MDILKDLQQALQHFAGISEEAFDLSKDMWLLKSYNKNEIFNSRGNVCTNMGFITSGVFRSYTIDEESGDETNVFLYSANGFVVTYKSFINQIPCDYHTQALADSTIISIQYTSLMKLFEKSHAWEKFGRLLAQEAFNVTMQRIEGFLFKSPEERYVDLINNHPDIFNNVPLYHISSYLGIRGPSLSRIRKRMLNN